METKPLPLPIVGLEKWQALGNNFIVANELCFPSYLASGIWPDLAQRICNRNFGIGADGLLIVKRLGARRVRMTLFNPDGSRAEMCGNGILCVAAYALNYGLWPDWHEPHRPSLTIETDAGEKTVEIAGDQFFRVNMGVPILDPEKIPVTGCIPTASCVKVEEHSHAFFCVSMGNPHAVTWANDDVDLIPLEELGPKIETAKNFPMKTNVEFVQLLSTHRIKMRVWERGAGATQACGTGACAAVVVLSCYEQVESPVEVELPGGVLTVEWDGGGDVFMTGSASKIADRITYYYTPA